MHGASCKGAGQHNSSEESLRGGQGAVKGLGGQPVGRIGRVGEGLGTVRGRAVKGGGGGRMGGGSSGIGDSRVGASQVPTK